MSLVKLSIRNFRNLHQLDLEPSEDINIIFGKNASGKTSILEAIYFLGRASSFRTNRFERLLENGEKELLVYASLKSKNGKIVPFGVKKASKSLIIRINEQKINKVSDLVQTLPLQIIHPNSHQLLEEGPKYRRRFLDWGVFHVEHQFYPAWLRYQKALKQRNAALRLPKAQQMANVWSKELVESAQIIDRHRRVYLQSLQAGLDHFIKPVLGDLNIQIKYQQGWKKDTEFAQALTDALDNDIERGFTSVGPQRADVNILVDGVIAHERISRGQQKILVTSLLLAQAELYNTITGKKCLLLIDDVAAELDEHNKAKLLTVLVKMNVQMFLTSIEPGTLQSVMDARQGSKMFHVEHGKLSKVV